MPTQAMVVQVEPRDWEPLGFTGPLEAFVFRRAWNGPAGKPQVNRRPLRPNAWRIS